MRLYWIYFKIKLRALVAAQDKVTIKHLVLVLVFSTQKVLCRQPEWHFRHCILYIYTCTPFSHLSVLLVGVYLKVGLGHYMKS